METPYEIIEHTADVGIIAHGRSLEELFANAATGMFQFLIEPGAVRPVQRRPMVVEAEDLEGLLVAWLNDLLVLLNADAFIPSAFDIQELSDRRLAADVAGEPVDPARHRFRLDVKAATYHQLRISKNNHWHAQIIFDV